METMMKSISKMKALYYLLLVLFLGILIADGVLAKSISVDRVRWKYNWCCWTDHNEYPEWKNESIWTEYRKKTYIGKYWQPSKSSVRNMVIIIAGQQGSSGSSGCSNCLTGQDGDWDDDWGKGDKSKTAYFDNQSLASRIIDSGLFSSSNTFLALVYNSNFNWENTSSAKTKAEKAFTKWFLKHGYSSSVDNVFILGSSRGGVLAVRMSKRIRQEGWTSTPVYVGIIDAVPNKGQNEIESNNSATCTNPLDSSKYLRWADLYDYYGGYVAPDIKHQVTGSGVILGSIAHAFCADNFTWYDQTWYNMGHTQIGRCVDNEGEAYKQEYMNAGIIPLMDWIEDIME